MKIKLAMALNLVLVTLASLFVATNCIWTNRPETPTELLKK